MPRKKSPGRPVNPASERSRKPWEMLSMSRANYYWLKRFGKLPAPPLKYRPDWTPAVNRKLTAEQVRTIKRLACELPGYKWVPFIALEYGVSESTIYDIINERTHKDIPLMLTPYSFA